MKNKLCSLLLALTVLFSLLAVLPVSAVDGAAAKLSGTDTFNDLSKVSGLAVRDDIWQQEAVCGGILHLNWSDNGIASFVNKSEFGAAGAPWVTWNVRGGGSAEFVGRTWINSGLSVTDSFLFDYSANGTDWTRIGSVTKTLINADHPASADLADEGEGVADIGNYNICAFTFDIPKNAAALRVVFSDAAADYAMAKDQHWGVQLIMLRVDAPGEDAGDSVTDTLNDLTKISRLGGRDDLWQQEALCGGILHLNWSENGIGSFFNKSGFGEIASPWVSWKASGGSTVEFAGRVRSDQFGITVTEDTSFRFGYSTDGESFTPIASDKIEKITVTADNVGLLALTDEGDGVTDYGCYVTTFYRFTLPADAVEVRVVYPEDMTDISMTSGRHFIVQLLMMRITGNKTPGTGSYAAIAAVTAVTAVTVACCIPKKKKRASRV